MAPIAKAAKSLNKSTPPRTFEFSVGHPIGLTALDVDLIKVGAAVHAAGRRVFQKHTSAACRLSLKFADRLLPVVGFSATPRRLLQVLASDDTLPLAGGFTVAFDQGPHVLFPFNFWPRAE